MRRSDGPALLGCLLLVLGLFLSLQMRSSDVSQSDAAVPDAADSGEDAAGANAFVAVTPTERPPRIPVALSIPERLELPQEGVEYFELPLLDVVDDLSQRLEVDVILDRTALAEAELPVDAPVSLHLHRGSVNAALLLRLILEHLGVEDQLDYAVRDGLLCITSLKATREVRVYDCRDLLRPLEDYCPTDGRPETLPESTPTPKTGQRDAGLTSALQLVSADPVDDDDPSAVGRASYFGPYGLDQPPASETPYDRRVRELTTVIQTTVDPNSWLDVPLYHDDDPLGAVEVFDGVLVIRQARRNHEAIAKLLEVLRSLPPAGRATHSPE